MTVRCALSWPIVAAALRMMVTRPGHRGGRAILLPYVAAGMLASAFSRPRKG